MRVLRHVVLVAVVAGLGCQRGRKICPDGTALDTARSTPGKQAWCRSRDGTLAIWIEFHKDKLNGKRLSCRFRNGAPAGTFQAWHQSGQPWVEGEYRDGVKVGKWTQWDKDGHKVAEGEYRTGDFVAGAPVGIAAQCEKLKP